MVVAGLLMALPAAVQAADAPDTSGPGWKDLFDKDLSNSVQPNKWSWKDGELVAGDLQVYEVPGAAAGEIALFDAAGGSLHLGDAVINAGAYGFSLLPQKYCEDAKQLRDSLRALLPLPFRLILFAHGTPMVTGAHQRFTQLLV